MAVHYIVTTQYDPFKMYNMAIFYPTVSSWLGLVFLN